MAASFPAPLTPIVLGRDECLEGKGSPVMKMLALFPVADEHGGELRAAGSAVWKLSDGRLTYIELDVTGAAYKH